MAAASDLNEDSTKTLLLNVMVHSCDQCQLGDVFMSVASGERTWPDAVVALTRAISSVENLAVHWPHDVAAKTSASTWPFCMACVPKATLISVLRTGGIGSQPCTTLKKGRVILKTVTGSWSPIAGPATIGSCRTRRVDSGPCARTLIFPDRSDRAIPGPPK